MSAHGVKLKIAVEGTAHGVQFQVETAVFRQHQLHVTGHGIQIELPGDLVEFSGEFCRGSIKIQFLQCACKLHVAGGSIDIQHFNAAIIEDQ